MNGCNWAQVARAESGGLDLQLAELPVREYAANAASGADGRGERAGEVLE